MSGNTIFRGVATALITPLTAEGIDYAAFGRVIDWQIEQGVNALVIAGTTGEGSTLTDEEHREAIRFSVERAAGRVPIIAGTGSNDTDYAISLSRYACQAGADALLVVTPYYNKASREGLIAHYLAVADSVELPIILYNVPGRTGLNLAPEVVAELAKHPNLCAVKEASGNLKQMTELSRVCGEGVAVYCGNDDQVVPAMALGARGVISVAANVIPAPMHALAADWLRGETRRSLEAQMQVLPLIDALFSEVNPIPVKAALAMMGRIENTLRLPLCPLAEDKQARLREVMEGLGVL